MCHLIPLESNSPRLPEGFTHLPGALGAGITWVPLQQGTDTPGRYCEFGSRPLLGNEYPNKVSQTIFFGFPVQLKL